MISPLRARWFALAMTYCLIIGAPVWSQSQGLRFAHLSIIGDGLSNETVTGIVQDDDDGFLWFGTEDGLNRYDGYTFTVFKHQQDDSLMISSNTIGAVCFDSSGNLWIGTIDELRSKDLKTRKAAWEKV